MSFCPENVGNWSASPQNESGFSSRFIQSFFPLLHGPSCWKSPSALFLSTWVEPYHSARSDRKKTCLDFFDPIGDDYNQSYLTHLDKKSADGDFLQLGPWRRGKQLRVEKTPTHAEARQTNFQHFRGKSSREPTESYFFNELQILYELRIQLNKNWPHFHTSYIPGSRDVMMSGC